MSELKNENVRNVVLLNSFYNEIVQKIVQTRKEAGINQSFIAEWLGVDRRKIIALENGAIDMVLLCKYADKLDIYINFDYEK